MLLLQSGTYWFMAQIAGAAAGIPRNTPHAAGSIAARRNTRNPVRFAAAAE
jgi:hypothetical protein